MAEGGENEIIEISKSIEVSQLVIEQVDGSTTKGGRHLNRVAERTEDGHLSPSQYNDSRQKGSSSTRSKGKDFSIHLVITVFNESDVVRSFESSPKDITKEAPCKLAKKEYNLRPRAYKSTGEECISTGGLAPNNVIKPQMGRKTFLSKAHKQAILDVKQGRQVTISRVLRDKALGGTKK